MPWNLKFVLKFVQIGSILQSDSKFLTRKSFQTVQIIRFTTKETKILQYASKMILTMCEQSSETDDK